MVPALDLDSVVFGWPGNAPFLKIDRLSVECGQTVFLQGASGSGKSTVLGLICGILQPRSGQVCVLGQDMASMSGRARDVYRAEHIGVIFQMFNLLPFLGVVENVLLGCQFSPRRRTSVAGDLREEARALLEALGLGADEISQRHVGGLSVGQQQRVAAARALFGRPELIIADEPTSALDRAHRDQFVDILLDQAERSGSTVIFVSHDGGLASRFDRQIVLEEINMLATGQIEAVI